MPGTSFDDVLLVNPAQIRPATSDGIALAEAELGVRMPPGYAAYVERLGEGALGNFVRVYAPARLPDLTRAWRERVTEYWFWDTSEAGVKPESLQERGVVVADSFDGDELCFDPADPETLFVLPRNDDNARRVGPGFIAAVDWMLSGALNPWVEGWDVRGVDASDRGEAGAPRSPAGGGHAGGRRPGRALPRGRRRPPDDLLPPRDRWSPFPAPRRGGNPRRRPRLRRGRRPRSGRHRPCCDAGRVTKPACCHRHVLRSHQPGHAAVRAARAMILRTSDLRSSPTTCLRMTGWPLRQGPMVQQRASTSGRTAATITMPTVLRIVIDTVTSGSDLNGKIIIRSIGAMLRTAVVTSVACLIPTSLTRRLETRR